MNKSSTQLSAKEALAAMGIKPCEGKSTRHAPTTIKPKPTAKRSTASSASSTSAGPSSPELPTTKGVYPFLAVTVSRSPEWRYSYRPGEHSRPIESPVQQASLAPPSSLPCSRPDLAAFRDALKSAGVDENWWWWSIRKREDWICEIRHTVWRRMKRAGLSLSNIGAVTGGFDHTTVLHALKKRARGAKGEVVA